MQGVRSNRAGTKENDRRFRFGGQCLQHHQKPSNRKRRKTAVAGADEEVMRQKCKERTRQGRSRKGAMGEEEGQQRGREGLGGPMPQLESLLWFSLVMF